MKNLAKLSKNFVVKNVKAHEIILSILLLFYIFSGVSTPTVIIPFINNFVSYIIALCITFIVLFSVNPYVGILFGIAFYILFKRTPNIHNLESSEESKSKTFSDLNSDYSIPLKFPKNSKGEIIQTNNESNSLEVEVIKKMAPEKEMPIIGEGAYEPIQAGGINSTVL